MNLLLTNIRLLKENQGFLRYLKNSSWMMLEQILRMIAGLLIGIWMARYLGPSQFGMFTYIVILASIFSMIAKLGLDGLIVRELINQPEKEDFYLATFFWLKLFWGLFIAISLMAAIPLYQSSINYLYILIIAISLVFQSTEIIDFYFQAKVLAKFTAICKIGQLILSTILKIYLIVTNQDIFWFITIILFDQITLSILLFYSFLKSEKRYIPLKKFEINILKKITKEALPFFLSSIIIMIHMRIDQILVGYMFGSYEVGIYAASIRISEISYSILALIIASLFPAILNAKNKDEEMYRERLKKMYSFIIYISIITAIPVVIFSKEFVLFLYGNSYSTSSELLNIHIWTGTFIALGIASRQWYITENLAELELIRTISGLIINIILCLALAPKFGLFGIAYSTLISHVVSGLIFDFANKKTINMAKIKIKALYPTAN